ncbi:ensconsin-like [Zootoca vivipara]|uniref:ensconsin-like n=1 Tax=Zootoca vivipara TaxID=8524 RepID=UPI00293BCBA2|nr:ensconsin-like [Zootoca vivipara]
MWHWNALVLGTDFRSRLSENFNPPCAKVVIPFFFSGSKRSTSSANLKQAETVISKRLSSSAARLNSPSKGSTKRSSSLNRLNNKVPPNSEQPEPKDASSKTALATMTAEEAARILAEKRRLAGEQREREDQERAQREEAERIRKEEVEKQAQLEEALREPEDERRAGEEEPQRQEEQEKMAELQLQREEAEAKALKEVEKQCREQEWIVQQNKQERLQRKKRIEEIMRRTRKAEQNDTKNEDKSNEEEDEGVEEDDELGLEKQDQPEKAKYDSSLKDGPEAVCDWTASEEERSKMEPDGVFVNGDEQEEVDRRNNGGGNSMYLTQGKEASPPAKDMVAENSEILRVNEADRSAGFLSNLNGNSTAWKFEEIIDLGIHPKTTIAAEKAAQSLKDAAVVPASPRLAFEERSPRNSFTNPIDMRIAMIYLFISTPPTWAASTEK